MPTTRDGGSSLRRGLQALDVLAEDDARAGSGRRRPAARRRQEPGVADAARARRPRPRRARPREPRVPPRAARLRVRGRGVRAAAAAHRPTGARAARAARRASGRTSARSTGPPSSRCCRTPRRTRSRRRAGRVAPSRRTARPPAARCCSITSPRSCARCSTDVELQPRGPNAVATVEELHARVTEAAERGYAVADEELEPGLVAVAAPVRRFDGRIVAAVNVSGPSFRFRAASAGGGDARSRALPRSWDRLRQTQPGLLRSADEQASRSPRAGSRDLRRGLPVRARAARLPAGRGVRARGRARAPRARRAAAPRVRPRRLGRRRGVHVLRAPREAPADRQGGRARGDQPAGAADRRRGRRGERRAARRRRLQHERLRPGRPRVRRDRAGDVRGAGRLGGRRGRRLRDRRDVLVGRRRR